MSTFAFFVVVAEIDSDDRQILENFRVVKVVVFFRVHYVFLEIAQILKILSSIFDDFVQHVVRAFFFLCDEHLFHFCPEDALAAKDRVKEA